MLKKSRTIGCLALVASVAAVLCSPAGAADAPGALGKLDTPLQRLVADAEAGRDIGPRARSEGLDVTRSEKVAVDVSVRGDAAGAARALEAAGMNVTAHTDRAPVPLVEGWLPVDAAERVARLDVTQAVHAVRGAELDVGAVTSQGDASHRGPQARALGVTGAGVKVGIVSDSINRVGGGIAESQSTGDLPASVQVLADGPPGSIDEGRAMAEIVYDTAPGITSMVFAGIEGGPVAKAANIAALRNSGATVIADDTVFLDEPFFEDGVVAQSVDAVKAGGVAYLVSAGNRGRQSWEGFYTNSAGNFHDFAPGVGVDTTQSIATIGPGERIVVSFQWGEPFGGATTDLDLQLINMGTGLPVAVSADNNIMNREPREFLSFTNPTATGADMTVGVRISRFAGAGAPFMKWIGNGGTYNIEHPVPTADAINPEAASALGSLAVAAVEHNQPGLNVVEDSSSRGPKLRLFPAPQVRQKPDIAAADGVATTVPGFNPFYGTSAAAPSAAGVAALVRSANPGLNVDQVYAILRNPANNIDCTFPPAFPQPDVECGFGFVLADRALVNAGLGGGGGAGPGPVPGAGPGPGPGAVPVPALTPCQKAQQALAAAKTAAKKAKGKKKKKAKRAVTTAKRAVKKACSKKKKKTRKKRRRKR